MTYRQFLEKLLKILRILIVAAPFVLFIWLVNQYFVPKGELYLIQNFHKKSFISDLEPENRLSKIKREGKTYFRTIRKEPVYFKAKVPRRFHEAEITVEYQNPNHPLFELGVLQERKKWTFVKQTIENQLLDHLDWFRLEKNSLKLWQKEKKYNTLDEFLKNIPDQEKIAQFNYNLEKDVILPDYQAENRLLEINKTLRGSFTMYTYIKNERLDFSFWKQDLNWSPGPDKMDIFISKGNKIIYTDYIEDDGLGVGAIGPIQKKHIQIPNLPEGIYKIQINTTDDVLTRNIQTKQHLLSFSGTNLYIASNENYGVPNQTVNLYSNTTSFNVSTSHQTSCQTFKINNQDVSIDEVYKKYNFSDELFTDKINHLFFPISDVLIKSNNKSVFSFTKSSFFNPFPENIVNLTPETNLDEIDYIIADYTFPQLLKNNWKRKTVKLEVEKSVLEDRNYRFMFSAPGLENGIKIRKIEILFKKEPITFKNFFSRLKGYLKRKSQI